MGGENLSEQTKWNRKFNSRDKFDLDTSLDDLDEPEGEKITKTDQRKTENVDMTNVQYEVAKEEKIMTDENVNPLTKDSSGEKTTPVPISSELKRIIEQNPYLLCSLELSLSEKKSFFQDDPLFSDADSFEHFLVRFAEKSPIITVKHMQKDQVYLKENFDDWKSLIDSYLNKPVIIYTNENFSNTYIFGSSRSYSKTIKSDIAKFFNPDPVDFVITPHVLEFITQNDKFSEVKYSKPDKKGNCKCTLTELRFAKLKEEMKKITCQSFLLDEIQYESLLGDNKDVLLEVENNFNVKGTVYEYKRTAEIPIIFVVNSLTRISCVVSTDPGEIPLDSLITIDRKEQAEVDKQLMMNKKPSYAILQYASWNIAVNHHIGVVAAEMRTKSYPWNQIIEYCLKIVLTNDSDSKTIGISVPAEMSSDLSEFCQSVWTVVENFPQTHERPICILLLVEKDKMKLEIIEIMKKISAPKPKIPSNVTNDRCVVDVISGLITEVNADAITCSVNQNLILSNGGVAKAILQKVGRQIQTECSQNHPYGIIFPELAITKGYNLPCKYIFFGALPSNDGQPNISTFVEICLETAVSNGLTSIAFPALGTGNLNYEPRDVAAEMESTIKKFMAKTTSNTLQKILIVIHPSTKRMEPFFEMKKTFDNESKGAIAKRRAEGPQANEPNRQKYSHEPLQWIQFLDYSAKKETIEAAIKYFEKRLKNKTFSVNSDEAEELFYFYDLIMLIPDIVEQLDSRQNFILVSNNSASQFEKYLTEFRTQYKIDKLPISSEMKMSEIKHYLVKIQQQYPTIKCEITANDESVRFHGPNFNLIQAAKYQLECFLGLQKIITVSKDRFASFSSVEGPKMEVSASDPASTDGMNDLVDRQNRILSADDENTEETQAESCFTMKDGFRVKIYQGDLLKSNVEGIVNAANKLLSHGAGVARAIIIAAGERVNKEGQDKLSRQPLNEGNVLTTGAGNLTQYKYIIHAVGPMYRTNQDDYCRAKIAETIYNTLTEANKLNLFSVALPAISSAIFGVPMDICTDGYFQGVTEFCKTRSKSAKLGEVHFVDMDSSRIKAIKLHFEKQLKTTGNIDVHPLVENFVRKENPTNITVKMPETCPVCLEEKPNLNRLKCKHICCLVCLKKLSQAICPICRLPFGTVYGDQPDGIMRVKKSFYSLPGYVSNSTYEIDYSLSTGYAQTVRYAYLPACKKGDLILKMLQLAFERRLIFTIGESRSSGRQNVITWNEIHHKTSRNNSQYDSFGYPDPNYFTRVTSELASKGITPDSVSNRTIKRHIEIRYGNVIRTYDL